MGVYSISVTDLSEECFADCQLVLVAPGPDRCKRFSERAGNFHHLTLSQFGKRPGCTDHSRVVG